MLILALPFGPPVHGMSVIADALVKELEDREIEYLKIPSQPWFAHRFYGKVFWTITKLVYSMYFNFILVANCIFKRSSASGIYLFLQSGAGQLLDLPVYLIARIFRLPIYIHHHSFSYLVNESAIMKLSSFFIGKSATHIFLCECMCKKYSEIYSPDHLKYFIISNIVFLEEKITRNKTPGKSFTLGYLSNITAEKGINMFVECFDTISQFDSVGALVAGRCDDLEIRKMLLAKSRSNKLFEFVGAVYGEQKEQFFDCIDVLIFPTEYKTEADPVVVLEALQRGIPVVSFSRGCIEQIIKQIGGLAISPDSDFVKIASAVIVEWISVSSKYQIQVAQIESNFVALHKQQRSSLNDLIDDIYNY